MTAESGKMIATARAKTKTKAAFDTRKYGEMLARTYHESQGKPIYVVRESLD